jgi:hypothetical protein
LHRRTFGHKAVDAVFKTVGNDIGRIITRKHQDSQR